MPKGNAPLVALEHPKIVRHKGGFMVTFYGQEIYADRAVARAFYERLGKLLREAEAESASTIAPMCKACPERH